jgi:hypothetical protein
MPMKQYTDLRLIPQKIPRPPSLQKKIGLKHGSQWQYIKDTILLGKYQAFCLSLVS